MLDGIRQNEPEQWTRFVKLFGPLVYEWCRRTGVPEHDSADIAQEVFNIVAAKIDGFRREQPGDSFHGWLHGITRVKCLEHFRQQTRQPAGVGGSTANHQFQQLPANDPGEVDQHQMAGDRLILFQRALNLIKTEFESRTWQSFWRVAIDGNSAADVAEELGMSKGAVYNAKYKILRRLRTEFGEMVSFPGE